MMTVYSHWKQSVKTVAIRLSISDGTLKKWVTALRDGHCGADPSRHHRWRHGTRLPACVDRDPPGRTAGAFDLGRVDRLHRCGVACRHADMPTGRRADHTEDFRHGASWKKLLPCDNLNVHRGANNSSFPYFCRLSHKAAAARRTFLYYRRLTYPPHN